MRKSLMFLLILTMTLVTCSSKEESARKMYATALKLQFQNRQPEEADKIFQDIIRKYPETQTAVGVKEDVKEIFGQALDVFKKDNGRYPTTDEGLEILFTNISNLSTWDGPYLKSSKSKYIYIIHLTYKRDGSEYILNAK